MSKLVDVVYPACWALQRKEITANHLLEQVMVDKVFIESANMKNINKGIKKDLRQHAAEVAEAMKKLYPKPKTELVYANEMQLAIAVMLSAQTTDKKVNEITAALFKKYLTWDDFAIASLPTLQRDIRGVNFHLGKASRIIKASVIVRDKFGGHLPRTMDELLLLPGVARKTANVILQELWDITEGIVVDTHVTRISSRLGLSNEKNAVKIEQELMSLFDKKYWRGISGAFVLHGRHVCKARKPECEKCVLKDICPSAFLEN
ncbi:MAG TPA: endonuclease III [bacterium]|nr:endonuclease III [bacterium]